MWIHKPTCTCSQRRTVRVFILGRAFNGSTTTTSNDDCTHSKQTDWLTGWLGHDDVDDDNDDDSVLFVLLAVLLLTAKRTRARWVGGRTSRAEPSSSRQLAATTRWKSDLSRCSSNSSSPGIGTGTTTMTGRPTHIIRYTRYPCTLYIICAEYYYYYEQADGRCWEFCSEWKLNRSLFVIAPSQRGRRKKGRQAERVSVGTLVEVWTMETTWRMFIFCQIIVFGGNSWNLKLTTAFRWCALMRRFFFSGLRMWTMEYYSLLTI